MLDNIVNMHLLANPVNWLIIFVIFTIWAVLAHYGAKTVGVS